MRPTLTKPGRSPQAAYQARRRACKPIVSFFPTDKDALDAAVAGSGLTQQAWLASVVDQAISERLRRDTVRKLALGRLEKLNSDAEVTTPKESQGEEQLPVCPAEQFELASRCDWLARRKPAEEE